MIGTVWRWGDFSYARRGGEFKSPQSLPGTAPFPFDAPLRLVNPTLKQVQDTFGPWWNQSWPEGMVGAQKYVQRRPDRTIYYAIWRDRLWVQCWAGSRHAPTAKAFSQATLDALARLDAATLKEKILTPEYPPAVPKLILERRDRVLAAARATPHLP